MEKDFYGFSFDGVHSSSLNILRVSDGDRYQENLHPEFEDRRTQLAGMDGEYYFGSDYQAKPISVSIAFDSVTEAQFRQIGYIFSTKKIRPLIFDERPYKMYMAKIDSPIELEYVCFDEREKLVSSKPTSGIRIINRENGQFEREEIYPYYYSDYKRRIYKGEGTIDFICPYPFARAPFKTLDDYQTLEPAFGNAVKTYENVDEWKEASQILSRGSYEANYIDSPRKLANGTIEITVYNPGDIDSPFSLYIPFLNENSNQIKGIDNSNFSLSLGGEWMVFNNIDKQGSDTGIIINTENHLIEGVIFDNSKGSWKTTGNLYNNYLIKGDFPKILHKGSYQLINNSAYLAQSLRINCDFPTQKLQEIKIFYDYLYY